MELILVYLIGLGVKYSPYFPAGSPARTVGWRDPGFIHTSFIKDLWPNMV